MLVMNLHLHVDHRDRARFARRDRHYRLLLGLLVAAGLTALVASGASCAAPKRVEAASAALRALEVSATTFATWSEAHQLALIDAAEAEDRAPAVLKAQIREFRAKRSKVQYAIHLACDLISLTMLDPSPANLARAITAIKDVIAAVERLREA